MGDRYVNCNMDGQGPIVEVKFMVITEGKYDILTPINYGYALLQKLP